MGAYFNAWSSCKTTAGRLHTAPEMLTENKEKKLKYARRKSYKGIYIRSCETMTSLLYTIATRLQRKVQRNHKYVEQPVSLGQRSGNKLYDVQRRYNNRIHPRVKYALAPWVASSPFAWVRVQSQRKDMSSCVVR